MITIKKLTSGAIEIFGLIIAVIGFGGFVGHVSGHRELYKWSTEEYGMGFYTSIAVMISGWAIFLIGLYLTKLINRDEN